MSGVDNRGEAQDGTCVPDENTIRIGNAARTVVDRYTVPIALLRDHRKRIDVENGSGVLLRVGDVHVVMTAGHVAQAARDSDVFVHIGVQSGPHSWRPSLVIGSVFVPGTYSDVGYMIINPVEAHRVESSSRVYGNFATRAAVMTSGELAAQRCYAFVAGYPFSVMKTSPNSQGARLLVWQTAITGSDEELTAKTTSPHTVGLVVPEEQYASFPVPGEIVQLPALEGVSGGGCWIADPEGNGGQPKLVGLHIASETDSAGRRIAREIMIGHALRLLAMEQPSTSDEIFGAFPELLSDAWDLPL